MAFGCRLLMLVERKEMLEGWKHEKAFCTARTLCWSRVKGKGVVQPLKS